MISQKCHICKKDNQNLLVLSCYHDPCIKCASEHFTKGFSHRHKNARNKNYQYWCSVCFEPTPIHQDIVEQLCKCVESNLNSRSTIPLASSLGALERQSNNKLNERIRGDKTRRLSRHSSLTKEVLRGSRQSGQLMRQVAIDPITLRECQYFTHALSHKNLAEGKGKKRVQHSQGKKSQRKVESKQYYCKTHPDELQNYYCFLCFKGICVQCALHGVHFGHEVQAKKKAGPRLKAIYQQCIVQSKNCTNHFEKNMSTLRNLMQNYQKWSNEITITIQSKFKELYQIMSEKQKQMLLDVKKVEMQGVSVLQKQFEKYNQFFSSLQNNRSQLKKRINHEISEWCLPQMEEMKQSIETNLRKIKQVEINQNVLKQKIKYVDISLICQSVQTMIQFVKSFKLSYPKKQ